MYEVIGLLLNEIGALTHIGIGMEQEGRMPLGFPPYGYRPSLFRM